MHSTSLHFKQKQNTGIRFQFGDDLNACSTLVLQEATLQKKTLNDSIFQKSQLKPILNT